MRQQRGEDVPVVERHLRLLGRPPEHDHDRLPSAGIYEIERAGEAGLVVQRGDHLVADAQGRTAEGLEDILAAGMLITRAQVICPGSLSWRSEAALAQRALGDRESAERLAAEELELARVFGAPRALGVGLRADRKSTR